jgi:hypothetical protein
MLSRMACSKSAAGSPVVPSVRAASASQKFTIERVMSRMGAAPAPVIEPLAT